MYSTNRAAIETCMPAALKEGGYVDQCLADARRTGSPPTLANSMTSEVAMLRSRIMGDAAIAGKVNLQKALAETSALLRICIAPLCDIQPTQDDYGHALAIYKTAPADYDAVLGRLLSAQFQNWAARCLHRAGYYDGSHPTAGHEWDIFLELLHLENQRGEVGLRMRSDVPALDEAVPTIEGLTFIAGPKGVGKTTLALSIMHRSLQADPELCVLVYSLEMDKRRLYERLLGREVEISTRELRSGSADVAEKIKRADERLRATVLGRLRIVERQFPVPHQGRWATIFAQDGIALLQAAQAAKLLVVVDNFQRLDVPNVAHAGPDDAGVRLSSDIARDDCRLDAIQDFRARMTCDSQPSGPPVIAVSEIVKREGRRRSGEVRPVEIDDLRGSGRMASDAETILMLWPTRPDFTGAEQVPMTLRIAKGRDGVVRKDIPMIFDHARSRMLAGPPATKERQVPKSQQRRPSSTQAAIDPLTQS